jgi:hypothetical protein
MLRSLEFDSFPQRAINVADAWRAARASNSPERAFAIAEWARSKRQLRQPISELPLSEAEQERAWAFTRACFKRFAIDDRLEQTMWRMFGELREPGSALARAANGDPIEVSGYGDVLADRYDFDASEVRRALRYRRSLSEPMLECDRAASIAVSVARDLISHAPALPGASSHEQRVRAFLASKRVQLDSEGNLPSRVSSLDGKSGRTYRVFAGIRYASGTYSYWMRRNEKPAVGVSSRAFGTSSHERMMSC